jgi:hypothetical protein
VVTAGVLNRSANGRIVTTNDAPTEFAGGIPLKNGMLCIALAGLPAFFLAGVGYTANGRLCAAVAGGPANGLFVNALGQIRVNNAAPSFYYAGLPVTANGRLAIVAPV